MIYFDYAATTPLDRRVWDAMLPFFNDSFGNPSSVHRWGQKAEAAVEQARETLAAYLNCQTDEVIFTSGGSEADNLALQGVGFAVRQQTGKDWILTSKAEHPAVTKTAEQMQRLHGFQLEWLAIDSFGRLQPQALEHAACGATILASVMLSNNEIGTINPIKELTAVAKKHDILLHTDAVQAAAYLPVDVQELGVDLLSLGAHKFYGPKGVGALYVRKGTPIHSLINGGGQEFNLRAGTSNVPYIVGFAEAFRLANVERAERTHHVLPLRDYLIGSVLEAVSDSQLTGHPQERMPNHASFVFKEVDGNLLLQLLDAAGFACSSGSACKTGNPEPSAVIKSLGLDADWALGSLRITLGKDTTSEQVNQLAQALPSLVEKARKLGVN